MTHHHRRLWWRLTSFFAVFAWMKDPQKPGLFCRAVLLGDEQFAEQDGGRFWAFHSAGASIVNADTCRVEHNIHTDASGRPLPDAWANGVYMERTDSSSFHRDGYVLINSGVTRYDEKDQPLGEVIVFSTNPKWYETEGGPAQLRVEIEGGRHYNSYGVFTRDEYWTEASGKLFIIHLKDVAASIASGKGHSPAQIQLQIEETQLGQAGSDDGIRGQMLWNENSFLESYGYVTSHEKVIHIVDMDSKEQIGLFNYSSFLDEGECSRGAHGIAFDNQNNHLFVECTWDGPTLELALDSPLNPQFITKHNASGWLEEDPIHGLVVASDRSRNLLHIFLPGKDTQSSSARYQVDVPGGPDMPSFFEKDFLETVVCMPLTENVNRNNMDASGNLVCDSYSCGPPETPQDVAAGMCLYDETTNNMELLRVRLEDYDKVVNEEAPYNNRCPRCKNRDSYHGGDICTCTPHCGSCADPDYDASKTGVRCFILDSILDGGTVESTLIEGAGAIQQTGPSFWQAQCSYGWTHRSSKRGGRYHASVAHYPTNSLQIVDMWTQRLRCQIDLPGKPERVLYVPPQPNQLKSFEVSEHDDDMRAGSITLIVIGCVACVVVIVSVLQYTTRNSGTLNNNWVADSSLETGANNLELSPRAVEEDAMAEQNSNLPAIT